MAFRKNVKITLAIALIAASVVLTLVTASVIVNQNVATSGTITTSPNIGVYSDSACTTNMTSINWGSLAAGGSATKTVYVKNTGSGTMTLSLAANNWSPSTASNYLTVTWDQDSVQLSAGQSVAATITLTVSSSVTGITSFSNNIVITGTG